MIFSTLFFMSHQGCLFTGGDSNMCHVAEENSERVDINDIAQLKRWLKDDMLLRY